MAKSQQTCGNGQNQQQSHLYLGKIISLPFSDTSSFQSYPSQACFLLRFLFSLFRRERGYAGSGHQVGNVLQGEGRLKGSVDDGGQKAGASLDDQVDLPRSHHHFGAPRLKEGAYLGVWLLLAVQ